MKDSLHLLEESSLKVRLQELQFKLVNTHKEW